MERVFFNRDILTQCLLPQIHSIFDIISFFATASGFSKTYKRKYGLSNEASSTLHVFHQRLKQLLCVFYNGDFASSVLDLLSKGKLFLTGGFLLAVIHNTDTFNDIDFCFFRKVNNGHRGVTIRNWYLMQIDELAKAICIDFHWRGDILYLMSASNIEVSSFAAKSSRTFKLLALKVNDSIDEHVELFDFSFCQNYFANNRLVCLHANDVKNKVTVISFARLLDYRLMINLKERVDKYRKRGYFFDIIREPESGPSCKDNIEWNKFWDLA